MLKLKFGAVIAGSAFVASAFFYPSVAFAQNDDDFRVLLCSLGGELEIFTVVPDGTTIAFAGRNGVVSQEDRLTTFIEGTTVYQFAGMVGVTRLLSGNAISGACEDISEDVASVARVLYESGRLTLNEPAIEKPEIEEPAIEEPADLANEIRVAVNRCWNIDPGSEAARVTTTIGFDLEPSGKVARDIVTIASTGGSVAASQIAYDAARRAVLRCQGPKGYDLPLERYNEWSHIEMTFAPSGAEVTLQDQADN